MENETMKKSNKTSPFSRRVRFGVMGIVLLGVGAGTGYAVGSVFNQTGHNRIKEVEDIVSESEKGGIESTLEQSTLFLEKLKFEENPDEATKMALAQCEATYKEENNCLDIYRKDMEACVGKMMKANADSGTCFEDYSVETKKCNAPIRKKYLDCRSRAIEDGFRRFKEQDKGLKNQPYTAKRH